MTWYSQIQTLNVGRSSLKLQGCSITEINTHTCWYILVAIVLGKALILKIDNWLKLVIAYQIVTGEMKIIDQTGI